VRAWPLLRGNGLRVLPQQCFSSGVVELYSSVNQRAPPFPLYLCLLAPLSQRVDEVCVSGPWEEEEGCARAHLAAHSHSPELPLITWERVGRNRNPSFSASSSYRGTLCSHPPLSRLMSTLALLAGTGLRGCFCEH